MKRYSLYVLSLFASIFLLSACVDEQAVNSSVDVVEGREVNLSLSFASGDPEVIQTKSALTEGRVSDLYVLLFDERGNRVSITSNENGYFTNLSGLSGSISFETTTGKRRIYGIANLKSDATASIKSQLDGITNESGLKEIQVSLKDNIVSFSGSSFLASGYYTAGKNAVTEPEAADLVAIDLVDGNAVVKDATTNSTIEGSIKLVRLFSNITFKISKTDAVDAFEPVSWRIVNVPTASPLYKGANATSSYFPTSISQRFENNSFEFAMLENLQSASNIQNKNDRESDELRPEYATYVELKGHFVGKGVKIDEKGNVIDKDAKVDANVTYFISLGLGADNASLNQGDYNSKRNKIYVYNVTVAGVNEIITEVNEKDPYHRADGDVTYVEGEVDNIDAHYESKVYTFNIKDIDAYGTDFLVKTPFTTGYIKLSDADPKDKNYAENWQWVRFMVNETNKNGKSYSNAKQRYPEDKTKLMDVKAFSDYIHKREIFLNNELKVTCFIDEYYYKNKNWTEFVNTEPRVLQIMCNIDSYTHGDNHTSSLRSARYTISQKSIQTIYALNPNKTAWGIEWVNETAPIPSSDYGDNTKGNNWNNGYINLLSEELENTNWYQDNSANLNPLFNKAYAACMSRNRDEDGDGVIDKDEMKWYLPAIYQYMDIWMGTFGLPNGFALYQGKGEQHHFYASNKKYILWAEEGSSFGNNNDNGSQGRSIRCIRNLGMTDDQMKSGTYPDQYYTENNLVFDLSNMNSQSIREQFLEGELDEHTHTDFNGANAPYKKFKLAKNVATDFTVKYLGKVSRTIYATGGKEYKGNGGYYKKNEGPVGYIIAENDSFSEGKGGKRTYYYRYYKIEEKEEWLDRTQNYISRSELITNMSLGNSPCKDYSEDGDSDGWRLPNQRELQMIIRAGKVNGQELYSWTKYAYNKIRVYAYNQNLYLTDGGENTIDPKHKIRCVKDIK